MKKVSVILSSYNHEKYIAASIESVLNQSFGDFELLIFDDGSTDASQQIIRGFDDKRIKLFLYEKNRGTYWALQEPLKAARGKYLALQHSDDIWAPNKLERQIKFLEENPEYAACFTQAEFIDESGAPYDLPENHPYKNIFKQANRRREDWLNYLFWRQNCFCNPSALIENDAANWLWDACLFQLPDYFMWLNICKRKNIYVLPEELVKFRLRRAAQNSVSSLSLEKSIRTSNETTFTARAFFSLTQDAAEFLRVFPEAEKYSSGGKIVPEFAFARLCLEHNLPAHKNFGLEILYDLLHNQQKARAIKELYGYDEKSFQRDTGANDVFGLKFQTPFLNARLYINFGDDFNEDDAFGQEIFIKPDGNFFARFDLPLKSPATMLRFDPDEQGALAIKITQILINGARVEDFTSNALEVEDGWHYFLGVDPAFTIIREISAPNLQLEISGVAEKNSWAHFENLYRRNKSELEEITAELQKLREELTKISGGKIRAALRKIFDSIKK